MSAYLARPPMTVCRLVQHLMEAKDVSKDTVSISGDSLVIKHSRPGARNTLEIKVGNIRPAHGGSDE